MDFLLGHIEHSPDRTQEDGSFGFYTGMHFCLIHTSVLWALTLQSQCVYDFSFFLRDILCLGLLQLHGLPIGSLSSYLKQMKTVLFSVKYNLHTMWFYHGLTVPESTPHFLPVGTQDSPHPGILTAQVLLTSVWEPGNPIVGHELGDLDDYMNVQLVLSSFVEFQEVIFSAIVQRGVIFLGMIQNSSRGEWQFRQCFVEMESSRRRDWAFIALN